MDYKTFEDLEFKPFVKDNGCSLLDGSSRAVLNFDNKYGVSVVCGDLFLSDGKDTYELGILYDGVLFRGPMAYMTSEQVTSVMIELQTNGVD